MKLLHLLPAISPSIVFAISEFAFSPGLLAEVVSSSQSAEIDVPLCYMQTAQGNTINLTTLCGRQAPPSTPKACLDSATKAQVSLLNSNYDGNFLSGQVTNQSCKTVKYIKVNYEVMDESGNLIDNGYIYAQPVTVGPGQSASFQGAVVQGAKVQVTYVDWRE